jgi:hypothetical protein
MRLVAHWQVALRLHEWQLTLRLAPAEELKDKAAYVEMMPTFKTATVNLSRLDRVDADLEEDLVHELLHLVFWQLSMMADGSNPVVEAPFEFGINATTHALVGLRRSARRKR